MKKLNILIVLTASLMWAGCGSSNDSKKHTGTGSDSTHIASVYQCPMDCEKGKTYDKGGKCSVCGMDLELKNNE